MSTTSKRSAGTRRLGRSIQAETPAGSVENLSRDEAIRCRAYDIYLERGDQPGSALDDWLQAERELA
jgi:hypothetical protein